MRPPRRSISSAAPSWPSVRDKRNEALLRSKGFGLCRRFTLSCNHISVAEATRYFYPVERQFWVASTVRDASANDRYLRTAAVPNREPVADFYRAGLSDNRASCGAALSGPLPQAIHARKQQRSPMRLRVGGSPGSSVTCRAGCQITLTTLPPSAAMWSSWSRSLAGSSGTVWTAYCLRVIATLLRARVSSPALNDAFESGPVHLFRPFDGEADSSLVVDFSRVERRLGLDSQRTRVVSDRV